MDDEMKKPTDSGKNAVDVWMTNLSWGALLQLLGVFLMYGRFVLRFTSVSWGGSALGRLLWMTGVLASPARQIENNDEGERVDDPGSASYRIQWGIEEFTNRFFATHAALLSDLVYPDSRVKSDRVLINLRKVTILTTYKLLAFVEFARYWEKLNGISGRRLVILTPLAVLADKITSDWAGHDVEFRSLWSGQQSLILWLGRGILRCVSDAIRWRSKRQVAPASIGVEFAQSLDRSALMDDLFWWWESGIPAERILLFFDRSSNSASRETVAQAEKLGIRCVVLDRRAVGDSPDLLWRPAPGIAVSIVRLWQKIRMCMWGFRRGAVGRWVACQALQMLYWAQLLEDFLVEFNVKGVFHYQDIELDHVSIACDMAGAARIGYQWSHLPWPMPDQVHLHQVYFTWGPQSAHALKVLGSCVDYLLLSGCIVRGAHPSSDDRHEAMSQRADVIAHGATQVLALFDTSLPCAGFYEFFLRRVLQDVRWGLLIKRKRDNSVPWVRQPLPKLRALYEEAVATGRVQMLDWRVSPAEAAAVADFSVGLMVVGISSPTIVAALGGHRAIHLDYVRFHESHLSDWAHFHKAGPDRLVFDDPEKLWDRLNRYFDEPGLDPALGKVDEFLLREIDPFLDGRAGERIGEYTRCYLEGLDDGLDRARALEQATRHYADKWGAESCESVRVPGGERCG